MKLTLIAALAAGLAAPAAAQNANWQYPAVPYGPVVEIPGASAERPSGEPYRVVFDVRDASPGDLRVSGDLALVGRFVNLLAQSQMDPQASDLVAVLHGAATSAVVSDEAYSARYGTENPNADLITALEEAGVEVVVCGQSLTASGFTPEDVLDPVEVSVSAMTEITDRQLQGYALMP